MIYTIPEHFHRQVGELAMDVNTGEIILHESNPSTIKEIKKRIQYIYKTTISSFSSSS